MSETANVRIPLTSNNINKCVCPVCPVQSRSKCVKGKMSSLKEVLKSEPIQKEKVPALYCGSGTAACQDIDVKRGCICPSCRIYGEYKLKAAKPTEYFCRDGAAG